MKPRQYSIGDILVDPNSLEDKFLCEICSECLFSDLNSISSLQCKEGHVFCTTCWKKSLERKKECMACRTPCDLKSLSKNIVLQNEFRNKKVFCPNKFKLTKTLEKDERFGCKTVVKIDELESHLKNCQFEYVDCPFNSFRPTTPNKCTFKVRKNGVEAHRDFCSLVVGVCKFCNCDLQNKDNLKQHQDQLCEKILVKCPQECGTIVSNTNKSSSTYQPTLIERGKIKQHILNDCRNTITHCKYQEGGCQEKFQKCNEYKHLNEVNHSVYIQNIRDAQFKQSKEVIKHLESENMALKLEMEQLKKLVVDALHPKIQNLETFRNNSTSLFLSLKNQISLLDSKLNEKEQYLNQISTLRNQISLLGSKSKEKEQYLNQISALRNQISSSDWDSQYVKPSETDHKYINRWSVTVKNVIITSVVSPNISFGNNSFTVTFRKHQYYRYYEIFLSLIPSWFTTQKSVLFNITLNHKSDPRESLTFKSGSKPVIFIPQKSEAHHNREFLPEQDINSFINNDNELCFDIFIQVIANEPSILKSTTN